MESKLPDMEAHFDVVMDESVHVYIHADIESFHKTLGHTTLDWMVAKSGVNAISLVCPYFEGHTKTPEYMLHTAAIHELAHVVSRSLNEFILSMPARLYEGIAGYEASDMSEENKDKVNSAVRNDAIPDLNAISGASNDFIVLPL